MKRFFVQHKALFGPFILGLLLLTLLMPSAFAGEPSGPVYTLEWLDAFYSGTGASLPKLVTADNLSVSPERNFTTVQRLQLTFTFSGEEQAVVPTNTVEIRLPYSIFHKADGSPAESRVDIPLPRDTSFNYYIDTATNEIVMYNFTSISEAMIFSVMIDYYVRPSDVSLPSGPEGPIAPYTNTVQAHVKISRPNTPMVEDTTNFINLSYTTDSKLSSHSKSTNSNNVYATWPSSWGTAPADAADYFYVIWNTTTYYSGQSTQPFKVKLTDTPGVGQGTQVVGWQMHGGAFTLANQADGWSNNLDEYHIAAQNAVYVPTPSTSGNSFDTIIVMRYPRSLMVKDPNVPGRKTLQVTNTSKADLIGDYGASDTLTSSASSYLYVEQDWVPPAGYSNMYKYAQGNATGMIDRLESAREAGSTAALSLHNNPFNWYINASQQQVQRTIDATGTPYALAWTAVFQDNQLSFDTASSGSSYYHRLKAGDYRISSLRLFKPIEMIYGEANLSGVASLIDQIPANYGSTKVQYTLVDSPTEADWTTLGTVTMNPPSTTSWTFTPADNTTARVITASYTDFDLLTMVPNKDVLGVRFLHTSKAAQAFMRYYIKTDLYPTANVFTGLRQPPARTGDIRDFARLYNLTSSHATGGSIESTSNYTTADDSVPLNRFTTISSLSKYFGTITQNDARKVLEMPVGLTMYEALPVSQGTTKEQAIALNALTEQTQAVFYDLLPIGTMVDMSTVRVTGYSNAIPCSHSVEVLDNFRDTGRSLLKVIVNKQEGSENFYFANSWLNTGFSLRFTLLNTYDNLLDNPKNGRNYAAYESLVAPLGNGHSDLPPTSNFSNADAQAAFTDVNNKPEADEKRFLHAYDNWSVNPPVATELGYNKLVKTPQDTSYSKETVAQGGGTYTYRLRLANRPRTSSLNLIFYDSLEDRAPQGTPFWQGTLESIDLSHPRLTWGLEPVVYYAIREVEPKGNVADRLVIDGVLNTAVWQVLDLNQPYPSDLKAIAVDMRFKPNGDSFLLPPERSLIVTLTMRAPGDVTPYVDPIDYAWNSSYLSAQTMVEGVVSANAVVDVTPTKVSLRPVDLTLDKTSGPATGTPEAPTVVYPNSTILYTLNLKNTNAVEAITGIVLEDVIPAGLQIQTENILYRFSTGSAFALLNTTNRIQLTQTGQKLSFAIDRLTGSEFITFRIPVIVLTPEGTETVVHENTAVVTEAFGADQEISSPTTYHETPVTSVQLLANKILNAGGRVPQAGEFQLELTDTTTSRNRIGGPYPNSGTAPYSFEIPPLTFSAPGTYSYILREIIPSPPEAGMSYSSISYFIIVNVRYDTPSRTLIATPVYRINYSSGTVVNPPLNFTNTYKANGNFTPTFGKIVSNTTFPQSFYENAFSATLTDEFNQFRTATNQNGVFTFGEFAFTEKDIGKVFTYTIKEIIGTQDSIKYDTREITMKVLVQDKGNGELDFVVTYWDGDTQLAADEAHYDNAFQSTTHLVTKKWLAPEGSGLTLPNPLPVVMVQLFRDGVAYGDQVDIQGESQANATEVTWTYTWQSIPLYQFGSSSELSVYTVQEVVPPPGFQVVTLGDVITNTYWPGTFTAYKIWEGLKQDPGPNEWVVTMELFQTLLEEANLEDALKTKITLGKVTLDGTVDSDPQPLVDNPGSETITYQEVQPWVVQVFGLKANGPDPRLNPPSGTVSYEYEVKELSINEAGAPDVLAPFIMDTVASVSTSITNRYALTTFTAHKVWQNGPKDNRPQVTLTLTRDGQELTPSLTGVLDGIPDGTPGSVSGEHSPWTYTWENLPRFKNTNFDAYVYGFKETKLDNYDQLYSENPADTVTNTYVVPLGPVTATKVWSGGPEEDHQAVTLILYRQTTQMDTPEEVSVTPVITRDDVTGEYTHVWADLEQTDIDSLPYAFTVEEQGAIESVYTVNGNAYTVLIQGLAVSNTFLPPLPYTYQPQAEKTLTGGVLAAGQFTFVMTDHEGNEHEVKNNADGSIAWEAITLTEPGSYSFSFVEKAGNDPLMHYDSRVFRLTLVLEVDENNQLIAREETWTRDGEPTDLDAPGFENTLDEPEPTDPPVNYPTIHVPLSAQKQLNNGKLQGGEFTFVLKDASGKVLAEAVNDANGSVVFPDRTFSREVTNYLYTISEKPGTDPSITYDQTVYTVKVTTRAENGVLSAQVTILKNGGATANGMGFVNEKKLPATGDSTPISILSLTALGAFIGLGAVLLSRRRKQKQH